jgi:hypothetical protein
MAATKIIVTTPGTLQTALNTAGSQDVSCISIELSGPNVITLSTPLILPTNLGNTSGKLIIEGNGVTIRTNFGGGTAMMSKAASPNLVSFTIRDINFDGMGFGASGLNIDSSIDTVIDNCRFYSLSDGLTLTNSNYFTIRNCQAKSINNFGYNITQSNSGSISNSRFEGFAAGNSVGFYIRLSNAVSMYDCSSSGSTYSHIVFESAGNVNTNSFSVKNITLGPSSNAAISLALTTGYVKFDGINANFGGILIRAVAYVANTSPNPHLYVENVPFLANNTLFETTNGIVPGCNPSTPSDAVVWSFKEVYTNGTDLFSASRWVSGLIPYYRYSEVFDESKTIVTNYMKVNSNIIS